MPEIDFILRLSVAILLGATVGVERQWRQRMAGLRTNALVSAGAALFVSVSQMVPTGGDQSRIASYVVSGIGFLGAGVIMKEGSSVRGLNTAATIWCSAAVGVLSGFGFYPHALIGSVAILSTNVILRPLAQKLNRQPVDATTEQEFRYQIRILCREPAESHIRALILNAVNGEGLVLRSIHSEDINGSQKVEVAAQIESFTKNHPVVEKVVNRLSLEKGVTAASWSSELI